MLRLLMGTDWVANRNSVMDLIRQDVVDQKRGRILLVPDIISHDTERRLCAVAGDTSSRFAEVLSFTRLTGRVAEASCCSTQPCLDKGGRVVAMAAACRQLHSRLKAYAAVETRPEFLSGLVEAVDEFKRCCVTSSDLMRASKQTQGSLAQKLEELSLILEAYDALCFQGERDPCDQLTWLLEQLEDSEFAREHVFYIDGFSDFTRQQMAIVEHLIRRCPEVTVSLNCDKVSSSQIAFEKAGQTAAQLCRIAKQQGIEIRTEYVSSEKFPLKNVSERLFEGDIGPVGKDSCLQVYRTETVHQEAVAAAEQVMALVRSGCRYRDVAVACTDISVYGGAINMVFKRCGIPVYLSGSEDILQKSVMSTVLSALDVALGGFEQRDVLRYLRSALSGTELDDYDKLENYAVIWNINGSRWTSSWEYHPDGLNEVWNENAEQKLAELNMLRAAAVEPLAVLQRDFRAAVCLQQQVRALCNFMEQIHLSERLARLADEMDLQGDNRSAQILNQLWEILLSALEQMHDVLGNTVWDSDSFTRLFKLLLSQYDVGTIPTVLDAVTVGTVSAVSRHQTCHLILMGATEGALPGYGAGAGILNDQERAALRKIGVPLTGGAMDGLQSEFSDIYSVFCGARVSARVFCPAGQPSFVYRRLSMLAGGEVTLEQPLGMALGDRVEAGAYLVRNNDPTTAAYLGITDIYRQIEEKKTYKLGGIDRNTISKLYGKRLNLSASQVDKLADCRLSYFLKYGLRARERKPVSVDPAEFGTYVHAVLELTVKKVMEKGGFSAVSLDEILQIEKEYSAQYIREHFSQIESQRILYLFRRNSQELELIVRELWEEMQSCAFVPVGFEVGFGSDCEMEAIEIRGTVMDAQLQGFVDRVDRWQDQGRNYYRVVDYKTGKKDFDYCDVFNGLGLQMLLYLFALENKGGTLLGSHAKPAGVQYFPARVPMVSADGTLSEDEAAKERERAWKRKGLLLNDEAVLNAMEASPTPKRLCCTRRKDGTLSGDLADAGQFRMLKTYIFKLLGEMVDEIASGCVEPNPYTRGASHNACAFCPYGAICNPDTVVGRRDYKAMQAQRFWDEVEKELNRNG